MEMYMYLNEQLKITRKLSFHLGSNQYKQPSVEFNSQA